MGGGRRPKGQKSYAKLRYPELKEEQQKFELVEETESKVEKKCQRNLKEQRKL